MSWVFGYGSLMWRPGFDYLERYPATLHGWHRAFCRYSLRHRGTEESPGMVVGLAPEGTCRGYAYRLDPAREAKVLDYLDDREGAGYLRERLPLEIELSGGISREEAWVYVPDAAHRTHALELARESMVRHIALGQGQSGTAHNYLVALIQELDRMGSPEPDFVGLLHEVEAYKRDNAPSRLQRPKESESARF
jgi:cation transport protein ChaC